MAFYDKIELFPFDDFKPNKNLCPLCGKKTKVRMVYRNHTHNVQGENINVRVPVNLCTKCGGQWSSSNPEHKSAEKAFLIFAKRKYPLARRFRKLVLKPPGEIHGYLCMDCYTALGKFKNALQISGANKGHTCGATGCRKDAVAEIVIGKT
jgi:hypothetical protein